MIYLASDHAGFELKEKIKKHLKKEKQIIKDLGPFRYNKNDDFPDYALKVCKEVLNDPKSKGILICGTGQGMTIASNKVKGIISAPCYFKEDAKHAREHLKANVITFSSKLKFLRVKKLIKDFLNTPFKEEKRFIRRLNKIKKIEGK